MALKHIRQPTNKHFLTTEGLLSWLMSVEHHLSTKVLYDLLDFLCHSVGNIRPMVFWAKMYA